MCENRSGGGVVLDYWTSDVHDLRTYLTSISHLRLRDTRARACEMYWEMHT